MLIQLFLNYILVDPCLGVTCSVSGEVCDKTTNPGLCKCGTASSCAGLTTGSYCDASNNICKCTSSLAACTDSTVGSICVPDGNGGSGDCNCTSSLSCTSRTSGSYCNAAGNSGFGECKCTASLNSCDGLSTGAYLLQCTGIRVSTFLQYPLFVINE